MRNFVGFYWTFPVRWAGFTDLSAEDADQAAKRSRTIAYQRELARRYVAQEKGKLVREFATIEISPDRGTPEMKDEIIKAGRICRENGATLLYVNFAVNSGWRPHPFIDEAVHELRRSGLEAMELPADQKLRGFDPEAHFSMWRIQDREERERRQALVPVALREALAEVPPGRGRYGRIARLLNERKVPTLRGGRPWTGENVRKALDAVAIEPARGR